LVVVVSVSVVIGYSLFCSVRDVSVFEVASNPQSFDGAHVRLHGYVVETKGYMLGPKYVLRDFDDTSEIALGGKGDPEKLDLESYVSFVFDGRDYTQKRNMKVSVLGYVRYVGLVMDAPSFYLDVEKVEPSLTELESIVTEFLKTTDVSHGGWNGTVEIEAIYDHKLGGVVIVVKYTTVNAGHPGFFMEAIEHHVAVLTLNPKGEVVSAFCVWGSFHNQERIWDLTNQRWIQK